MVVTFGTFIEWAFGSAFTLTSTWQALDQVGGESSSILGLLSVDVQLWYQKSELGVGKVNLTT